MVRVVAEKPLIPRPQKKEYGKEFTQSMDGGQHRHH